MATSQESAKEPSNTIADGQAPLPLRKDSTDPHASDTRQDRDIHDTFGGKLIDFFIYKVMGVGVNSGASIGVTYYVNPRQWAKDGKDALKRGANKLFKNIAPERAINSATEILIMMISGTVVTTLMVPLAKRREQIAYWINQKLGKDKDVLPDQLKTYDPPVTLEDRVEQELKKRVNYAQTSGDLWKARWSSLLVPLAGDSLLSKWNDKREAKGKWSTDTASWRAGQHLYDKFLPKSWVKKLSNFFEKHGAGINDMRNTNPVVYNNLRRVEEQHDSNNQKILNQAPATEIERNERMMIADQTRLLGKEVGWTLVFAHIMEKLTGFYQHRRILRQEDKALAELRAEGIIPKGISVDTDRRGHVTLTPTKEYVPPPESNHAQIASKPAIDRNDPDFKKFMERTMAPAPGFVAAEDARKSGAQLSPV